VAAGVRSGWISNRDTMEMKQMMACPVAEINAEIGAEEVKTDASQAKMNATLKN
jgi:hypothetical protein